MNHATTTSNQIQQQPTRPIEIRIPQYRAVYGQNGEKYIISNLPSQGNYVIATVGEYMFQVMTFAQVLS